MSPLGKVITLAALSCPLAWAGWVVKPAADCDIDTGCEIPLEAIVCAEGPCMEENDETSLLQAQSTFTQGRERLQEDGPKYVWTQAGIEHITHMPKVMKAANNPKPGDELTEQVIEIMTQKLKEKGGPTFEELIGKAFTKESLLQEEWPTPVHDWYAETDSIPDNLDAGDVTGAFDRNLEKVRLSIDSKVAHDLEFQDTVRKERHQNEEKAEAEVDSTVKSAHTNFARDSAAVKKVADARAKVVKEATEKVDMAKENAEAHAYKEAQAKKAAIEGRLAGADQAWHEAVDATNDMHSGWEAVEKARKRKEARKSLNEQRESNEAAVNKATADEAQSEEAYVQSVKKWKRGAEAEAAANAAVSEDIIEGAEGMKNHLTKHAANVAVDHYERHILQEQSATEKAADASYPAGEWPAGP